MRILLNEMMEMTKLFVLRKLVFFKLNVMTLRTIAAIAFMSVSGIGHAQNIDSLKNLLPQAYGDARIDILSDLAFAYVDVDNERALVYGRESFSKAVIEKDSGRMIKAGKVLALALRRLDKIDSAILIAHAIVPMAEKLNVPEAIKIYNGLGVAMMARAKYDRSLRYHFRNLELLSQYPDTLFWVAALNNIGVVYYKLQDDSLALFYYRSSLKLRQQWRDSQSVVDGLLVNIGLCHKI